MQFAMNPEEHFARFRERAVTKHGVRPDADLGILGLRPNVGTMADEDNGNRDLVVIATTHDIDGEDEVVVPGGIDVAHFMQNKAVFRDHWYGVDDCVGTMRRLTPYPSPQDFRGYTLRVRMHDEDLPNRLLARAKDGAGPGASIGFEAIDRGPPTEEEAKKYARDGVAPRSIVRRCRLLEVSLTHFPCNVACQGLPAGGVRAYLDELVEKDAMSPERAKALGWEPRPARKRVVWVGV